MITIKRTNRKNINDFDDKEWDKVNFEHFGRRVDWVIKNFIFKAVEDEKIVGVIYGKYESGVIYVDSLIVAKDKRGQGIGTALIEKVKEFGKKYGAHKMYLITGKDWKSNGFYKNLGFQKTSDLPNHHFNHDFVIYSKFI